MQFLSNESNCNNDSCDSELSPLSILSLGNFFKGIVTERNEEFIPQTFVIMANDSGKTFELLDFDQCPGCFLTELDEAMREKNWRPVAIEFCQDEDDDFDIIDLFFFDDEPSEQDVALIKSMFVNPETTESPTKDEEKPSKEN